MSLKRVQVPTVVLQLAVLDANVGVTKRLTILKLEPQLSFSQVQPEPIMR